VTGAPEGAVAPSWALRLYSKSALKRDKVSAILAMVGDPSAKRCLDLGSDNGVVSYLLRGRGGRWASADLTPETVEAIRELVRDDVHLFDGARLPFPDAEFDLVVVADMMEHVGDDRAFARELARVVKPAGALVVNTPHAVDTTLRRARLALGQTDEKHGHVRPGYTIESLRSALGDSFDLRRHRTYCRFFSESIDAAMQWALERVGKGSSKKGVVVTGTDLDRHAKLFRTYSYVFPFVWAWTRLDALLPWTRGYRLIAAFERRPDGPTVSRP
jgi:SAM-dependent methyltransferase